MSSRSADDKEARFAEQPEPECHLCGNLAVEESHFCHGCNTYICEDCAVDTPVGSHEPHDHVPADYWDGTTNIDIDDLDEVDRYDIELDPEDGDL